MGSKPISSIREAFSELHMKGSGKKVMLGNLNQLHITESLAFLVQNSQIIEGERKQMKGRPWCDHYRRAGHTKEICWKIQGILVDWRPTWNPKSKEARGNTAAEEDSTLIEPAMFSKEQMKFL